MNDSFQEWLFKNTRLGKDSVRDVVSRLKRVEKMVGNLEGSKDLIIKELNTRDDYKKLSTAVRSQLKRSVVLYTDYQNKSKQ